MLTLFQFCVELLAVFLYSARTATNITIKSTRYEKQHIVVTGGSSGVGLEASKEFVARGATVILTSRYLTKAVSAANAINHIAELKDTTLMFINNRKKETTRTRKNPLDFSGKEQKHAPTLEISADGSTATASVPHGTSDDHFIAAMWVELESGVCSFELNSVATSCTLPPNYNGKVTAYSSCNLHGVWREELLVVSPSPRGLAIPMALQLTDKASITNFADELGFFLGTAKLDILALNAGMFYGPEYTGPFTTTRFSEPVDTLIAANHLGHFLLVDLLKPKLTASRIIFTSSVSHWLGSNNKNDVTSAIPQTPPRDTSFSTLAAFGLYGATKLQNVLFAFSLQRKLPDATVVIFTPGFVATDIGKGDRKNFKKEKINILDWVPLCRSAKSGGNVMIAAAEVEKSVSEKKMLMPYWLWEGAGILFGEVGLARGVFHNLFQEAFFQRFSPENSVFAQNVNSVAYDEEVQDEVWAWSERVIGKF